MKYYDQETCEVISEECEAIWWLRGDTYHEGSDVIEPHYNVAYKQSSSNEVQGIEIENEHIAKNDGALTEPLENVTEPDIPGGSFPAPVC